MGLQPHTPARIAEHLQINRQIRLWQSRARVVGPFNELETRAGQNVTKTRLFEFTRIVKTVKIKMPYRQNARSLPGRGNFIGLKHGVAGAFDAPLYPQTCE